MELPTRKQIRLPDYDYGQNGAYFITICTKNRQRTLWNPLVGTAIGRPNLSDYGRFADTAINNIAKIYPNASVDKYVIMPNHIHLLLILSGDGGRPVAVPTISQIINQMKGYASRQAGFSLWQGRYYEHAIRNEADYLDVWQYIDGNPSKWPEDEYYAAAEQS